MAEANGVRSGVPEPDDWLEWVPREVEEAMSKPRFRRMTPTERVRMRRERQEAELQTAPPHPRLFKRTAAVAVAEPDTEVGAPRPPESGIDGELARRLDEVEGVVARAQDSVDRRARQVASMMERAARSAGDGESA
jgi:hypothetical protein